MSKSHYWMWEHWLNCWNEIREVRKGKRLIVASMGELVDGIHHGTVELVSYRRDEQESIAVDVMTTGMDIANFNYATDKLYILRSTAAHSLSGAQSDERIGKFLQAVPYKEDENSEYSTYSFPNMVADVDGTLIDMAHHGTAQSKREWLKGNTLLYTIKSVYFERLNRGLPIPNYWVRAHTHRYQHVTYEDMQGTIHGVITPSFQLGTEYIHRVLSSNVVSDVGLFYIVMEDGMPPVHKAVRAEFEEERKIYYI